MIPECEQQKGEGRRAQRRIPCCQLVVYFPDTICLYTDKELS